MQLEFQQLLAQQLATFRQPAAVDQSSRRSAKFNAMPRVPPGIQGLVAKEKKRVKTAEFKRVRTENIDLAPSVLCQRTELSDHTQTTVKVFLLKS